MFFFCTKIFEGKFQKKKIVCQKSLPPIVLLEVGLEAAVRIFTKGDED